jgi:hypothetical protein
VIKITLEFAGNVGGSWYYSLNLTKGQLMNKCSSCGEITSQFITDDGEYYYAMCGECY